MELLKQQGRAPAQSSKTVTAHRFEVPSGTEALVLTFDYGPRESRDRAANLPLIEAAFDRHIARRRAGTGRGAAPPGCAQDRRPRRLAAEPHERGAGRSGRPLAWPLGPTASRALR